MCGGYRNNSTSCPRVSRAPGLALPLPVGVLGAGLEGLLLEGPPGQAIQF